ncbi:PPE domain-containing protein [Actinophytocola sediminis]
MIYDMVRTWAIGASVIARADPGWRNFATVMSDSQHRIDRLNQEVGVSWEGSAAAAMAERVSPLSKWTQDTVAAAEQTKASLQQIADSFARTSHSMPEPVHVPSRVGTFGGFVAIVAGMVDADSAEYRARAAKQLAVELMNAYTVNNEDSRNTAGTFTEPPEISAGVAERAIVGGRAGGFVDGASVSDDRSGGDAAGGSGAGSGGPSGSTSSPVGPDGRATLPQGVPTAEQALPISGPSTPGPTTSGSISPVAGILTDPTAGRPSGSGDMPGRGGSSGGGGSPSRGGLFGGSGAGGRGGAGGSGGSGGVGGGAGGSRGIGGAPGGGSPGGAPGRIGAGALAAENAAVRGTAAGARGGAPGAGFGPLGTGARDEEDKEHTSPEYLRGHHDDFWDDTPPTSPPVIGHDG